MSLTVRINDKVYSANPGETIIDVLKRNNIYVPHVCLN